MQLEYHISDKVLYQWQSWADERGSHADVGVGDTEHQQSQGPYLGESIREGIPADGDARTVLPPLLPELPSQGSSSSSTDPVQALVLPSMDSGHTSIVNRHQFTSPITHGGARAQNLSQPDGRRPIPLLVASIRAWQDMWQDLESEWPRTALTRFPTVGSSNSDWNKVAQMEPRRLLTMVRRFPSKCQLLQVLSDATLVAWSAVWRQECMYDRLGAYRDRTSDHVTKSWLDGWKERTSRQIARSSLSPLIDSSDDWRRLKDSKYGGDDLLRRCDLPHKVQLARHILCVLLYNAEIKSITGKEAAHDTGIASQLQRHFAGLKDMPAYRSAFTEMVTKDDWSILDTFFEHSITQVSAFSPHQY